MDGSFWVAVVINALLLAASWGSLTARVKNIEKLLNNGFTCKYHNKMTETVGKLEGAAAKK